MFPSVLVSFVTDYIGLVKTIYLCGLTLEFVTKSASLRSKEMAAPWNSSMRKPTAFAVDEKCFCELFLLS